MHTAPGGTVSEGICRVLAGPIRMLRIRINGGRIKGEPANLVYLVNGR